MLPIRGWRIWYADGSTFSNEDGTWAEAPPFGLTCVVYYKADPYRLVDSGGNDGVFIYHGTGDLEGVKLGVWLDAEGCHRIHEAARNGDPPRFLPEVE